MMSDGRIRTGNLENTTTLSTTEAFHAFKICYLNRGP